VMPTWAIVALSFGLVAEAFKPFPPLHADGPQLRDVNGTKVRLECVGWSGAEQNEFVQGGMDKNHPAGIVDNIDKMGFNCVRLPFSVQMVLQNPKVAEERLKAVPEMKGKTALEVYDLVIKLMTKKGIMVMLDNHNSNAGWCCDTTDKNGLWYNDEYPEKDWLKAWEIMADRYGKNPRVIGAELRNEPRKAQFSKEDWRMPTWGKLSMGDGAAGTDNFDVKQHGNWTDEKTDWAAAAERGAKAVHAKAPNWLIAVDALSYGQVIAPLVEQQPINIRKDKLMFAAHDYAWFRQDVGHYKDFERTTDAAWGNLAQQKDGSPIWLSEFGTRHDGSQLNQGEWGCNGASHALLETEVDADLQKELSKLKERNVDEVLMKQATGMSTSDLMSSVKNGEIEKISNAIEKLPKVSQRKGKKMSLMATKSSAGGPLQSMMNVAKGVALNQRIKKNKCWWPYLMKYLKDRPHIGYAYWRLDGSESKNPAKEFGAEEPFGLLDTQWTGPANGGPVVTSLQALRTRPAI